ncbi:hypothetical protein ANCCAN_28424 [Ancylostoma caninum]|uniref:Uncharacterized protein n=1 Tax=Ancylostoma caninum TaxID=29170 RepID=A0A368F1A5_ANCCA|nr:hypothetical protein ANCCAN_28424 [Ancylostoma caninum]
MVEPRPPERVSQESDTDDENERLIDMALEDGRNAMKQVQQMFSMQSKTEDQQDLAAGHHAHTTVLCMESIMKLIQRLDMRLIIR